MRMSAFPPDRTAVKLASRILAAACVLCLACTSAIAQQPYDPAKADPADFTAVKQVCTVCHDTSRLMHSRPWRDWLNVLSQMSDVGARGSDEQWDHISRFLLLTLTTLDVNTAPADEIAAVLQVGDDVAAAIVARRSQRKFTGIDDLQGVAHVAPDRLINVGPRLTF